MSLFPLRGDLARLNRRAAVLALGSLFALPSLIGPGRAPVALPPGDDPFTLGVASGMPREDSVVLWTRLAPRPLAPGGGLPPAPITVRWELADDARFSRIRQRGEVLALPDHAHSLHVAVAGLPSGAVFFYRFIAGGAVSPTGRTRTAPAANANVGRLRIALASCQHYEQGAYAVHREIAARDLDFVLFVGDYIYESSHPRHQVRVHEGPAPVTLDGYRARHATYKLDADLRAAHAAHPWVLTWDDHEVENDYVSGFSAGPNKGEAFLRLRTAAYKAYFEHLPVSPSRPPQGAAMRIHDHFAWGRLADLWTLDNRQYRSRQACTDAAGGGRVIGLGCAELADAGRTVLGAAQERWLAQGLATSARRWKLIGQASQISESAIDTPLGRRLYTDGWDGYPGARQRLMRAIADPGVRDVVCLGGDVHRHVAAQLRLRPNDTASPILASEFVCSSVTTRGVSEAVMAWMRAGNPDMLHARSDQRGYALLDITPEAMACEFRATSHPVRAAAQLHTQARMVVQSGQPGVQRDLG